MNIAYFKSVLVGLLLLPATALVAKMPPPSMLVQRLPELPVSQFSEFERLDAQSGVLLSWYQLDAPVQGGTPEQMARGFIRQHAGILAWADEPKRGLRHVATRSGLAGFNVHFQEFLDEFPVYRSRWVVHISPRQRVTQFARTAPALGPLRRAQALISAADAEHLALASLQAASPPRVVNAQLVALPRGGATTLAWQLRLSGSPPFVDWEVLLDATTGAVLSSWDQLSYARGAAFVPDPLSSSRTAYGQPLLDDEDRNYSAIAREVKGVDLGPLLTDQGQFRLASPWALVVDTDAPKRGLLTQASTEFLFSRDQDGFEATNTFWHIQQAMRYVNQSLGVAVMPYQYPGGVRFDPHALDGDDNSYYNSGTGQLGFGEGCVDDAEDADVIWHELGHGLHDWLTVGGLSNLIDGLSEGFGDYWAQSYSRSLGQWQRDTAEYDWVFNWDGHNECWGGRVTNYALPWPVGITPYPGVHGGGQIWSSCLMGIYDEIGRRKTDLMVLEGLAMTNQIATQNDAAQAVYQAAEDLAYSAEDLALIAAHFQSCGYLFSEGRVPAESARSLAEPMLASQAERGGAAFWWLGCYACLVFRRKIKSA